MKQAKLHFVVIEDPEIDLVSHNIHADFAAKNLAIIHDGSAEFATMNALVLREALLNTPSLLKRWGYKLVKIEEPKPKAPKPEAKPKEVKATAGK